MRTAAFVSFRFGGPDGVSVIAAAWMRAFTDLGFAVRTVAGAGITDVVVPWLTVDPADGTSPDSTDLADAIDGADVVVVENVLSIPLNLDASLAVAAALRGRPAVLHHHDPPWQRARFAHVTELPIDDPAWRHVVINRRTQAEFAERGIPAVTIYNGFDLSPQPTDRAGTRRRLGVADGELLLLHPVRAIERKNVPGAVGLAEAVGATYWLPGPAEEGYGPTLERVLAGAGTRVLRTPVAHGGMDDAYAAADGVLFPSTWEGFGNPPLEAAAHCKPVVVGRYPVADELRALGFCWLDADDPAALARALAEPDHAALTANLALARRHCSYEVVRDQLCTLLADLGARP